MLKIIKNQAKCKKCQDVIVSEHRHDFKWCKCKAIFVDGGHAYTRRGGDIDSIIEMSIYDVFDEDEKILMKEK